MLSSVIINHLQCSLCSTQLVWPRKAQLTIYPLLSSSGGACILLLFLAKNSSTCSNAFHSGAFIVQTVLTVMNVHIVV